MYSRTTTKQAKYILHLRRNENGLKWFRKKHLIKLVGTIGDEHSPSMNY